MSRPAAKGWCPSALRPMKSGDGLLVRIKPNFGQLNSKQLLVLADCLDDFGNGLLDITSRTNLQIRGVKEQNYSNLILKLQIMHQCYLQKLQHLIVCLLSFVL